MTDEAGQEMATYSSLPCFSGDGYGFGGGAIVTIGGRSIHFGEGAHAHQLAEEVAKRWNAARVEADPATLEDRVRRIINRYDYGQVTAMIIRALKAEGIGFAEIYQP